MVFFGYLRGGNNVTHELHGSSVVIGREGSQQYQYQQQQQQQQQQRTGGEDDKEEADEKTISSRVALRAKSVSDPHARIDFTVDLSRIPGKRVRASVTDLGSLNGTFLNHERIQADSRPLRDGDLMRFGYDAASYTFRTADEEEVCRQYSAEQQQQQQRKLGSASGEEDDKGSDSGEGQNDKDAQPHVKPQGNTLSFPSAEGITTVPLGYEFPERQDSSEDGVVQQIPTGDGRSPSATRRRQLAVDGEDEDEDEEEEEDREHRFIVHHGGGSDQEEEEGQEMKLMRERMEKAEAGLRSMMAELRKMRGRLRRYQQLIGDAYRSSMALSEESARGPIPLADTRSCSDDRNDDGDGDDGGGGGNSADGGDRIGDMEEDRALQELRSIRSYLAKAEKRQREDHDHLSALRQRGIERYASHLQIENRDLRVKIAEMDDYIRERCVVDRHERLLATQEVGHEERNVASVDAMAMALAVELRSLLWEREWEVQQLKAELAEAAEHSIRAAKSGNALHRSHILGGSREGGTRGFREERGFDSDRLPLRQSKAQSRMASGTASLMLGMIEKEQHLRRLVQEYEHRHRHGVGDSGGSGAGKEGESSRADAVESIGQVQQERDMLRQRCRELEATVHRQMSDVHVLMMQKEHKMNEWRSQVASIFHHHQQIQHQYQVQQQQRDQSPHWMAIQQQQYAKSRAAQFIIEQLKREEVSHQQTQLRLAEVARQQHMTQVANSELKLEVNQLKDMLQYTNAHTYHTHVADLQHRLARYEAECGVQRVVQLKQIISELGAELRHTRHSVELTRQEYRHLRAHIDSLLCDAAESLPGRDRTDTRATRQQPTGFHEDPCIAYLEQQLERLERAMESTHAGPNDRDHHCHIHRSRHPSPPPPPMRYIPLQAPFNRSKPSDEGTPPTRGHGELEDAPLDIETLRQQNDRLRDMLARQTLLADGNHSYTHSTASGDGDTRHADTLEAGQQQQQQQQHHEVDEGEHGSTGDTATD